MKNHGSAFTGVTQDNSGLLSDANNGLSESTITPGTVVLGQNSGQPGNPAILLNDRTIPLNNFGLFLEYIGSCILGRNGGASVELFGDIAQGAGPGITFMDLLTNSGIINFDGPGGTFNFLYITGVPQTTGMTIRSSNVVVYRVAAPASSGALFQVDGNASVGNVPTASSQFHLGPGVVNANGSPFKYTAGVNLATPEDGAKEFDGTNEFLTAGSTRYTLAKTLTAVASLNFPNTLTQTSSDLTIALTGAVDGDVVVLGVPIAAQNADSCYTAFVSAANVVTVRFNNYSLLPINPNAGNFRVSIIKY